MATSPESDAVDRRRETAALLSDHDLLASVKEGLDQLKGGEAFWAEEVRLAMREART
ncbi:hypothetical protein [Pseudarthrobacter phenanthrenivorans]|uniref:hypothetical protein n=1 Tax=Pseudarthrobacter phenanthrenivorans TaxID=361575 RepID=UPI0012DFE9A5|nr:hypothetical protein [Pseudarthrobacter phenanthrenivorans]